MYKTRHFLIFVPFEAEMTSNGKDIVDLTDFSISGIQQIGGIVGDTVKKAIFWLVVFICSSVVLSYQISYLVAQLESYPIAVDIQITNGVEFPTVTFCSLALLKKSVVRKIPVFKAMEEASSNPKTNRKKRNVVTEHSDNITAQHKQIADAECPKVKIRIPIESSADNSREPSYDVSNVMNLAPVLEVPSLNGTFTFNEISLDPENISEIAKLRTTRSVASTDCSTHSCHGTPIVMNNTMNAAFIDNCVATCVGWGAVSYAYSDTQSLCDCYSEDCCTYSGWHWPDLTANPQWFCGTIAKCDNIIANKSGDRSWVYEQTVSNVVCKLGAFMIIDGIPQSSVNYTCEYTGLWAPPYSPCIYSCPNLTSTTGLLNSLDPIMPGIYTFTCARGYLLFNYSTSQQYTCQSDGTWKPSSFNRCQKECPLILRPQTVMSISYDGLIIQNLIPSGLFATFSCIPNYTKIGTNRSALCVNGNWNMDNTEYPQCLEECQLIVQPQTVMKVTYSGTTVQNLIPSGLIGTFACHINYTIFGTKSTKCDNGTWSLTSAKYPICLAICNAMDSTILSDRLNVNYSRSNPLINGTIATFSCNDSYHMYGDFPKTNCLNGSWDVAVVDFPVCLEQQVANYDAKTLRSFADPTGDNNHLAIGLSMIDMISYITANLSESMKISLGFGMDDNLVSCAYDGRICDKSTEIIGFNDDSGGNCYSFNHKYLNESIIAERPGMESGLHWILNTRQEEFLSMMPTAGVKLLIHQRFDSIFADSMGIQVSPGFNYIIAIRRKTELRVETPNSICYNQTSRANYYFLENSTYGIEACKRSYSQAQIINGCGCGSPNLPHSNSGSDLCTLENRTCVTGYLNETNINKGKSSAYCAAACSNVIEQTVVTMTANSDKSELFDPDVFSKSYQRSNLVSVKVFFETLEVQHFNERISYGILDLINDVASAVGVMVGMSFVSLFELIALAVRFGFYLTKLVKKRD